tara:strand:+ start:104 stop:421 length:318 start_codon:yes stop_codon:yes gene_type:complete
MDRDEELIDITIRIGNTRNNDLIIVGKSYVFNVRRNTFVSELMDELSNNFTSNEEKEEIKKYVLFTNKIIRLYNTNTIMDTFKYPNAGNIDIIDMGEDIFYALLI